MLFCILPNVIRSPRFTNDYKFCLSVNKYRRHSNLNFAHHFAIHWLIQIDENKNQHQELHQRETIHDNFAFFAKTERQKKSIGWAKYVYVCKWDMCKGIFVSLPPWWLENVKSGSKVALFSNEHHFKIWFPKKKTTTFFRRKLSKLHKQDKILQVTITFSLKGETRTSSGPICDPLTSYRKHQMVHTQEENTWIQWRISMCFVELFQIESMTEVTYKRNIPEEPQYKYSMQWHRHTFVHHGAPVLMKLRLCVLRFFLTEIGYI